jgi:hypothetical protein
VIIAIVNIQMPANAQWPTGSMISLTGRLEVNVTITCIRSGTSTPAAVATMPNSKLTVARLTMTVGYLPANLNFMNCNISDTHTRLSAPFWWM